ncbi:sensor histidine kinase [Nocardiopsis exhalans]|uniref:histidine kinase n=1 Tax=Nocardiopsis exhalans TaxID=163604 RepID=A0ABY5D7N2_9ACTN|nr:sensor histidine kinase [Nocardiopsis exhalans]USY19078.1 sensor histidine kinase [Nocardiopsis exhalans]
MATDTGSSKSRTVLRSGGDVPSGNSFPGGGGDAGTAEVGTGETLAEGNGEGFVRDERAARRTSWATAFVLPAALFVLGLPLLLANYGPSPLLLAAHLLLCLSLMARMDRPLTVFVVVLFLALLPTLLMDAHVGGELGVFVAFYHVVVRRPLGWGLGASFLIVGWAVVTTLQPGDLPPDLAEGLNEELAVFVAVLVQLLTSLAMVVIALVTGVLALVVRDRRNALAAARADAERLRVERDQRSRLAKETERTRIARELHDVVGHSLGVMVSLSDGASRLARTHPERAGETMATVAETGRSALSEVRDVLGLLRSDDEGQRYTRDVGELVGRVRASGMDVSLECERDLNRLPDHVRLCVYRVVQESLTNVGKHAGPGARAEVNIGGTDERVRIRVSDDGTGGRSEMGSGLTGLEERVEIQGGQIRFGPVPGGGWTVYAEVPVHRTTGEAEAL